MDRKVAACQKKTAEDPKEEPINYDAGKVLIIEDPREDLKEQLISEDIKEDFTTEEAESDLITEDPKKVSTS